MCLKKYDLIFSGLILQTYFSGLKIISYNQSINQRMKKIYTLLLLFLSAAAFSQYNFTDIDALLKNYNKPTSPGLSIHVVKDCKVLYSKQSGMADIENRKPITKESVFHMASDSKQFTAACIVVLQQQDKLKFDDKLSKYFPNFPEYAQKVTIANLMNHTSGIKDIAVLAMLKDEDATDYNDNQVQTLLKNAVLDFEPGTKWSYSNSGYWFLAQIVKQVSGKPMIEFVNTSIFKPLKMKNSQFVESRDTKFANKVKGYEMVNDTFSQSIIDPYHISGAGLYAPIADLQKWLNEMMDQKVLGKAFWSEMLKVTSKTGYAAGLFINDFSGHKKISHGGDNPGFHCIMGVYPDDKLSVIVLANTDDASVKDIEKAVAAKIFGITEEKAQEVEGEVTEGVVVSSEKLKQYGGIYGSVASNFYIQPLENRLWLMQIHNDMSYELSPVTQNSFTFSGIVFSFEDSIGDVTQTMVIDDNGSKEQFARVVIDPKLKTEYCGKYFCKSLTIEYTFFEDGDILKFKIGSGEAQETLVVTGDKLYTEMGNVKFKRDALGKISGFVLKHDRANNIEFEKI